MNSCVPMLCIIDNTTDPSSAMAPYLYSDGLQSDAVRDCAKSVWRLVHNGVIPPTAMLALKYIGQYDTWAGFVETRKDMMSPDCKDMYDHPMLCDNLVAVARNLFGDFYTVTAKEDKNENQKVG